MVEPTGAERAARRRRRPRWSWAAPGSATRSSPGAQGSGANAQIAAAVVDAPPDPFLVAAAGRLAAQGEGADRLGPPPPTRSAASRYSVSVDDEPVGRKAQAPQRRCCSSERHRRRPPPHPDLRHRRRRPGDRQPQRGRCESTGRPPKVTLRRRGRRLAVVVADGGRRPQAGSRLGRSPSATRAAAQGSAARRPARSRPRRQGKKRADRTVRPRLSAPRRPLPAHGRRPRPRRQHDLLQAQRCGSDERRSPTSPRAAPASPCWRCWRPPAGGLGFYGNGSTRCDGAQLVSADYARLEQGDDTTDVRGDLRRRPLRRDPDPRPQLLRRRRSRPAGRVPRRGHLPLRPADAGAARRSPTATSSDEGEQRRCCAAAPRTPRSAPTAASSPSRPPAAGRRPTPTTTSTSTCGT